MISRDVTLGGRCSICINMLKSVLAVSLFIIVLTDEHVSGQNASTGIITGKVSDAESNKPLFDAVVFLSGTPLGTSSVSDGSFRILGIPAGEYELIVSRVGYERKSTPVNVHRSDSLYFDIKLGPQPFQAKEVEVFGERSVVRRIRKRDLLFPREDKDMFCIYSALTPQPIGVLMGDSAVYMYSLDTAVIDSEKYIQLWLLYKNLSHTPYDFNPGKCIRMHMTGGKHSYAAIPPASPATLHAMIDTGQLTARIVEIIGQPLRVGVALEKRFSAKQRNFEQTTRDAEQTEDFMSQNLERWYEEAQPADDLSFTSTLFKTYRNSLGVVLMQRYTVFPNNSVNGFIFFPFPGMNWKISSSGFHEAFEYDYQIELMTQDGKKIINFLPG